MIIIHNANILTLDPKNPRASALIVERGRIIAVGQEKLLDDLEVNSQSSFRRSLEFEVINLNGKTIIPGLVDAHIHLEHYSLGLQKLDCETDSMEECLQRVKERAANTSPGTWILGHGWNQNRWGGKFGTTTELDAIAPNHPVYLTAKSLHAAWANTIALRLANVSLDGENPAGGKFGRDEKGRVNGVLFESAMDVVAQVIPEPGVDEVAKAIQSALPILWKMGLTGVHDFDRRRCFSALQQLHRQGFLKLRVIKSIPLEDLPHAVNLGLQSGFGDDFLRIGGIKAFADGALGPQTAAMLQPFDHTENNRGMLLLDAEELFEYGRQAVDNGLSMSVHAIGDRANHEVLKAFDQLRSYEAQNRFRGNRSDAIQHGLRHRIEHVQLIHPDDVDRLSALGIIASMQPLHAPSDMYMADQFWGERAKLSYAWRAQLEKGAVLAFGSDAPVESPNPFWGIHAAVTRRRMDGSPGEDGWYPEQCLSIEEALQAYTRGPAIAANQEDHSGKIAAGYQADLVVLNNDPFTIESEMLHSLRSVATMIAGEWVYSEIT